MMGPEKRRSEYALNAILRKKAVSRHFGWWVQGYKAYVIIPQTKGGRGKIIRVSSRIKTLLVAILLK